MGLFSIEENKVEALRPTPFGADHKEIDLQMWSAAHPQLLNNGWPMLSLGIEIGTTHGHAIDNLFIDGNGCLVVAELKRGKSPRDVTAQVVDYGAHANRLDWPQVEAIWEVSNEVKLDQAYRELFGYDLVRAPEVKHRLMIVAENFDPSVQDAATYLISSGIDLVLMSFNYYGLGETKLLDMSVVLGEIPVQSGPKSLSSNTVVDEVRDGHRNWLIRSIREKLPGYARERGIDLTLGSGTKDLTFAPDLWPFGLGEVRFLLTGKSKSVGLYFSYQNDKEPKGFRGLLEEAISASDSPYELSQLVEARTATTLSYSMALPEMGDMDQIDDVIEETWKMVDLIAPIVMSTVNENSRNPGQQSSDDQAIT